MNIFMFFVFYFFYFLNIINKVKCQDYFINNFEDIEIENDGWSKYIIDNNNNKVSISPHGRISWIEDRAKARALAREGNFYLAKSQYMYTLRKYRSLREKSVHDMHIELGQLLVIIGEPEQALISFQEALSFQPESHMAHYHLGMLATRVGSFHDAIKHYKNALFYDSKHCQTLHNLGSLLFLSLHFEEAEYYFLNALDKNACVTAKTTEEETSVSLEILTRKLLDHFLGAFVAQIQNLSPETNGLLERYYRQLSEKDKNLVTANILIHCGEAMYRQGLAEESVNMWQSALDIQNVDASGLQLQVAIAVPLYLMSSTDSIDIYDETMDRLNKLLDSSKSIRIPYPEIRCRISTVLTSLEFHLSNNKNNDVNQYNEIAQTIVKLIRRTTPSMNFISEHLINWHTKKERRRRIKTNLYVKSLKQKNNAVVNLPIPKTKIGFVSGRFYSDSTELRMIYRFITETSFQYGNKFSNDAILKKYHTTLIVSGYNKKYETDQAHMELRQAVDRVLFLSPNVTNARETLNNYALDILIFIAPTKDDQIYWLSYGRYAPVQIIYGAGGGTTGLCNSIDYFFVSDKMANQDIYESYSEQIIRK